MPEFKYTVKVKAADRKEAERVLAERLYHDEDYGFDYEVWVEGVVNDPGTNG
jgi:hypothetical protein